MRRLLPTVAILPWPFTKLQPPLFLPLAFRSTITTNHPPEDADLKNAIKAKFCQALKGKQPTAISKQLHEFFELKNVSTWDCNRLLEECQLYGNAQVANSLWMLMMSKQIKLDTYSVASLLNALCQGGLLDEALTLLYKLGKDIDVQPQIKFCVIFLRGCSSARSVSYVDKCLDFIKKKGLKGEELVYIELLKLAGSRKNLRAANKAWILMLKSCKPSVPSLESYCTVINAFCRAGSFVKALNLLKEMAQVILRNEGLLLKEKLAGITSLCKSEDMVHLGELRENKEGKEAAETNVKVEGKEKSPDESDSVKSFDTGASSLSESSSLQGSTCAKVEYNGSLTTEGEGSASIGETYLGPILDYTRLVMLNLQQVEASSVCESVHSVGSFSSRCSKIKEILRETFNFIIEAAVNKGDLHLAEILFTQMQAIDLKPNILIYNVMLRGIVRGRGLEQGYLLIKSMEQSGLQPDTQTYTAILEGFCSVRELDKAEALLERMLKTGGSQGPCDSTFNILLKACGDSGDSIRALRIFSKMVEAGVKPDRGTILNLVSVFGRVNFPFERGTQESQNELTLRIAAIESYMEHVNLPHNFITFNAVLAVLSTEGMTDAIFRRLQLAEGCVGGDGLPILDTVTFNTAINGCNLAEQWSAAQEIFRKMQDLGYKPDKETYNIFINGCAGQKKTGDAFHYLETMEEVGVKPDLISYNTLIKVLCYSHRLDAAVNLLREMEKSGMKPCIVTITTLLHCAVIKDRLDVVEFLVEHMHWSRLPPDLAICELVVSAYLNCGQMDDAVESLRVLSMRMLPKGQQSSEQMEDIFKKIFFEDGLQVDESTSELLKDAMDNKGAVSEALLATRLSGFGNAAIDKWNAEESWWAKRLKAQYMNMHASDASIL